MKWKIEERCALFEEFELPDGAIILGIEWDGMMARIAIMVPLQSSEQKPKELEDVMNEISKMTPGTKKFLAEKLGKIIVEVLDRPEED